MLSIHADAFTVRSLVGTVTVGRNKVGDDCVCAFSQVGRDVAGVQSGAGMFDPVERSKVVQIAIDKLRATLAA